MATSVERPASGREEDVQLTEREKWQLAIGLGAIACGIILVFGFSVYLFGINSTIDTAVGVLALGAFIYFAVVLFVRTFWGPS